MSHSYLLEDRSYLRQLRVFLEELCADLCRFQHITEEGLVAKSLRIRREVAVGSGLFVDVLVNVTDKDAYAMEVKFGYPVEIMLEQLKKKYGPMLLQPTTFNGL